MASLVKQKPFCKVFGKMAMIVVSMSHVGKKPREAGFTSVVQIAKWLLHGFSLEAVFLLGVWQGFCRSQWRSTWKNPVKRPLIKWGMVRSECRGVQNGVLIRVQGFA
jgi:hypothetical protein